MVKKSTKVRVLIKNKKKKDTRKNISTLVLFFVFWKTKFLVKEKHQKKFGKMNILVFENKLIVCIL